MNRQSQAQLAQSAQVSMPQTGGLLQRKCACGNHTIAGGECQECGKKRLQTKLQVNEPGDVYEQEADRIADQVMATPAHPAVSTAPPRIQRFSGQSNGQMDAAPASVDNALASPGRPLEPALRQDMEQRLGYDFSQVRVHSGAAAEQSVQDVNAHAYTVGHNIVFGAGRFAPGTHQGRRLLAHELTHVVQQTGNAPALSRLRVSSTNMPEEHEAHSATAHVAQGKPANISLSAAPGLVQRQLCGGQPLPPCQTKYISIPSDPGIGNTVGEWVGLQYRDDVAGAISSYFLVDHNLYYRGQRKKRDDLSQRTSRTGPPRPAIDADVYTALQTHELFQGLRPDILDSDRDHLYEIKPVRGAGAGPAQLNGYLRRLRRLAATAPAWMGHRNRDWQAGTWRPRLQLMLAGGAQPLLICVYPDDTPGVLLYDILSCPPRPRETTPAAEPARQRASAHVPLQEPARQRARVRLVGNHPYFEDLANRLPYMEAPAGRDFIVVIDDEIFRAVETEAERLYMEQQQRLLRPDPRGIPIIQAGRTLPYLAIVAGVAAAPLIATAAAPLVATAGAAATVTTATTATATTVPVATTAATTATAVPASTIIAPATIAAKVAPVATAAATTATAVPAAAITAPTVTWGAAKFTSAAAIVASLIGGGMSKAHADTVADAMKQYIGKRVLAMADVTMTKAELANVKPGQDVRGQVFRMQLQSLITVGVPEAEAIEILKSRYTAAEMTTTKAELANAKPGQAVSINGQTFRVIIRLKTPN